MNINALFAACAPGLEQFLTQELQQSGLLPVLSGGVLEKSSKQPEPLNEAGGVEFPGDWEALYCANLFLRTASRVLARLGEFYAINFAELARKAAQLPWEEYLLPGQPIALRATCHKSRLYHSDAVAQRIAEAIAKRLGKPAPLEKFDENAGENSPQLIVIRMMQNRCTISIDSSGAALHRRGYRLATAKAPLRETLAAGMLLASGWDKISPLIDPFCGSGTIAIEAALLAQQRAPGKQRRFAFLNWPGFDKKRWKAILAEAQAMEKLPTTLIFASDRDAGAIQSAKENARRAGLENFIQFNNQAISAIEPPDQQNRGWIVTNPPYGVRISADKDLRNLYARFGNVLRDKCPGWDFAMLCSADELLRQTGLKFDKSFLLDNGGVKVKLLIGKVK